MTIETTHPNIDSIPAGACVFGAADFAVGDNGDNAKTIPVHILARSAQPIEHWYWGRVVHDLAGMKLSKSRVAIDYDHDTAHVIGYANHFEVQADGLHLGGALVPYGDNDRATEVIHKSRMGIPYQASINFGGDGIRVQELSDGEVAEVNGYQFAGPGVIIRQWPLRGVAITAYGADERTETAFRGDSATTFRADKYTPTPAATAEGDTQEIDEMKPTELSSAVVEAPVAEVVAEAVVAVEAAPVDAAVLAETNPEETAEVAVPTTEAPAELAQPADLPDVMEAARAEFAAIRREFGDSIAATCFENARGRDYAVELRVGELEAENARLKSEAPARRSAFSVAADERPGGVKSMVDVIKQASRRK